MFQKLGVSKLIMLVAKRFIALDRRRIGNVFVMASLVITPFAVAADRLGETKRDTKYFFSPPGADELGQHLFPDTAVESKTRSISFADSELETNLQKSVGLPILFHFGKTTIVAQSLPFLDDVGEMMRSEQYADRTLIVEGHTDAVGSAEYNQRLSELRALAVKDYLIKQFNIDPLRLFPAGRGESLLYKPEQPNDGVNRRVEFLPYKNS